MAEDAVLIEIKASWRIEVGLDARQFGHPVAQTKKARGARRSLPEGLRKSVFQAAQDLKKRQIGVAQLPEQKGLLA